MAISIWPTAHRFGKRSTDFSLIIKHNGLANFVKVQGKKFGEIDRRIFCQTLCTGNFSLGAQMLVKSTPGASRAEFRKRAKLNNFRFFSLTLEIFESRT